MILPALGGALPLHVPVTVIVTGTPAEKFTATGNVSVSDIVVLTGIVNVPLAVPSVIRTSAEGQRYVAGNWSCILVTTMLLSGVNTAAG